MAIINSKQRKELSKDEFGLPEERRYPLIDKAHVLKAIQFFKYCPDDKKKTLAKNINAKAREYGMKINCKGSFAKYISPDVVKHANEAFGFDVTEASNIGTLSPIVGGIQTHQYHKTDEDLFDPDDIIMDAITGGLDLTVTKTEESAYDITYNVNPSSDLAKWLQENSGPITGIIHDFAKATYELPTKSNSLADYWRKIHLLTPTDRPINTYMSILLSEGEKLLLADYIVNDGNGHNYLMERKKEIISILMDYEDHKEARDIGIVIDKVVTILRFSSTAEELRYLIAVMYAINRLVTVAALAILLNKSDLYNRRGHNVSLFAMAHYVSPTYSAFKTISPNCPNTIINELNDLARIWSDQYKQWIDSQIDYFVKGTDCGDNFPLVLQDLNMGILPCKWYFTFNGKDAGLSKFDNHYFIGDEYTVKKLIRYNADEESLKDNMDHPFYVAYTIGHIKDGQIELCIDQYLDIKPDPVPINEKLKNNLTIINFRTEANAITTEGMTINKFKNRLLDIASGIHVSNNGDVKINLQNKLTFEHYEEIHKVIKENAREGNYEAMKENLAYIFALIGTIEKLYMSEQRGKGKSYLPTDPEYQSMVRLRALLISDFKVYMRILQKHDRNFNFLEYYNQSNVNHSVYVLKGDDIKNASKLLRMIML